MTKKKKCIGFPKGPCSGVPNQNPNLCDKCDEKRIDHLDAQFDKVKATGRLKDWTGAK